MVPDSIRSALINGVVFVIQEPESDKFVAIDTYLSFNVVGSSQGSSTGAVYLDRGLARPDEVVFVTGKCAAYTGLLD